MARWSNLILLAVVLLPRALFGSDAGATAMELLHRTSFDWTVRVERVRLARDLVDRVENLRQRVPLQKPSELERLNVREAKLEGGDPQALSRLFLSAAYQHRTLERLIDDLLVDLDCVLEAVDLPREMRCWSQLSIALLKEEQIRLALRTLRRSGRMQSRRKEPLFQKDPQLWFSHYGLGVLVYLIDPYLAAAIATEETSG